MATVLGYRITEHIHAGFRTTTYRAIKESDNRTVVIKTLKAEYPTLREVGRLKHEYEIAKELALPNIIQLYSLENYGNSLALVMEDVGGVALRDIIATRRLDLATFFTIALQLSQAVADLHARHIIHK